MKTVEEIMAVVKNNVDEVNDRAARIQAKKLKNAAADLEDTMLADELHIAGFEVISHYFEKFGLGLDGKGGPIVTPIFRGIGETLKALCDARKAERAEELRKIEMGFVQKQPIQSTMTLADGDTLPKGQ